MPSLSQKKLLAWFGFFSVGGVWFFFFFPAKEGQNDKLELLNLFCAMLVFLKAPFSLRQAFVPWSSGTVLGNGQGHIKTLDKRCAETSQVLKWSSPCNGTQCN